MLTIGWLFWRVFYWYTSIRASFQRLKFPHTVRYFPSSPKLDYHPYNTRKPVWVRKEVLRLKGHLPDYGCRKLAILFNRLHLEHGNPQRCGMSVSKSTVATWLRQSAYELQVLQREMKHKPPYPVAFQRVWGVDLTGKSDAQGDLHSILGIVEHGSRANLCLQALADKSSITLLRALLDAVEKYGTPRFIRTDNEAVFTSRLFTLGLWILGIKHQTSDLGCPWQNGRIERFFGTLKQKLNHLEVDSLDTLNTALLGFRVWYNHIRPHQNLAGCTPAEVWQAKGQFKWQVSQPAEYFETWDGLLRGFWFPPPEP